MKTVLRALWENSKSINISIVGTPKGEERGKAAEITLEDIPAKTSLIWGSKQTSSPGNTEREHQTDSTRKGPCCH